MATYNGVSIVDYLKSAGQKSDYATRASLAASKGIQNYQGTAEQNTQLLNLLRGNTGSTPAASPTIYKTSTQPNPNITSRPVNALPGEKKDPSLNYAAPATNPPVPGAANVATQPATGGYNVVTNATGQKTINGKTAEQIQAEITKIQGQLTNTNLATAAGAAGANLADVLPFLTPQVDQAAQDKIRADLGIPDLEKDVFKLAPSTEKLYNDAYGNAGLADVKKKIEQITQQVADKQKTMNEQLMKIDENPFLSEASRVGRTRRVVELFQGDINALNGQVTALTGLYNSGVAEIGNLVGRSTADFNSTQQINTARLNYLQQQAENKIGNAKTTAALSVKDLLPGFFTAKSKSGKPETIGSAEAGYYQYDPTTGKFKQVVAGSGTKQTESASLQQDIMDMSQEINKILTTAGYLSPENYNKAKRAWVEKAGRSAESFDSTFASYRDPNGVYTASEVIKK